MTTRHSLRVAVFALICFSLQATYVAPARAAGALRTAHCCATRCHQSRPMTPAQRCCRVEQDGSDVARISAPQRVTPDSSAVLLISPTAPQIAPATAIVSPRATLRHSLPAAPLYLLTGALRL